MKSILTLVLVLFAINVNAQTHPCDLPPVNNPQIIGNQITDGFCHDLKDELGQTITITAFSLYVDGVKIWGGILSPIGSVSSSGMYYFETPRVTVANYGNHTAYITVTANGIESLASNSIPFVLVATKASAAVNKTVKR